MAAPGLRLPAVATLCVTASAFSAWGIGAPFWGLIAGLLLHGLDRLAARRGWIA